MLKYQIKHCYINSIVKKTAELVKKCKNKEKTREQTLAQCLDLEGPTDQMNRSEIWKVTSV